jgi:transcriptional regulator with XRE-family HTH domain
MKSAKKCFRSARASKGYTQADVAKIMKIDASTLSRWENDVDVIPFGKLKKLCRILGIRLEELE